MPPAALSWIFITEKCIQDWFSKSINLSFDRSVPRILSPSIIQRAHCKEHLHLRFEVFVSTLLGLLTFNFVGRTKQPLMYRHWKKKDVSKTNSSNLIGEKLNRKICAPLNFKKGHSMELSTDPDTIKDTCQMSSAENWETVLNQR